MPEHAGGKRHGLTIVATFHTHPNPGPNFLQAPGPADIMNVLNDLNLDHSDYEGEFVLASEWTYRIAKSGVVAVVRKTHAIDDVV